VSLYLPSYSEASATGYVYEDRWIVDMYFDRLLEKDEIVYHINGIKDYHIAESRFSKTVVEK
jgi:hypothetical protein